MKHFSKPIFILFILFNLQQAIQAQDPHFSQFYASPWNLNPALTGVFNGKWRAAANYRDQWNSFLTPVPFRTYSASFDTRFNVNNDDYASFGIGLMHDEAGTARYMQNQLHIGGAFLKQLSGGRYRAENYLSAGAQLGMGQNSIDWSRIWFSRQFDPAQEAPDFSASNGEPHANASTKPYLNFNAGLLWYVVFVNKGYFYMGAAAHHLNAPGISLVEDNKETLYPRWSGQAGAQLPLNDNFALLPGLLVMKQGPALESNLGLNIRYTNNDNDELALRAGAWMRVGNKLKSGLQPDAVIVTGMVEYDRWTLGLSYDITVSSLTQANNSRGAFELSLTYIHPEQRRTRVTCPVF